MYQSEELHYPHDFAARLVLEVYATELAALPHKEIETTPDRCPHCGFPILCSIALEEGMGRRRSPVCSICSSEWPVPRLGCLRCGEQRASELPVFRFDAWTHIRVEVCDSCGGYLKAFGAQKDLQQKSYWRAVRIAQYPYHNPEGLSAGCRSSSQRGTAWDKRWTFTDCNSP
jgi:formate dehydrogenase maturation protein FdhE